MPSGMVTGVLVAIAVVVGLVVDLLLINSLIGPFGWSFASEPESHRVPEGDGDSERT